MNELEALNRTMFLHINGSDDTPAWLIQVAIGMANYLIYLIPLLVLGLWLWGDHVCRSMAIKACLVAMLGVAANQGIGMIWPYPRPFMIGLGHAWITHAADSSFPSDHMTVMSSIAVTLLFDGAAGWGTVALFSGLCVAWARIFLGVHFPLDMVGSIAVASAAYAITSPVWRMIADTLTRVAEKVYRQILARPIAAGWVRR
jgi:undecaprenyl-diphosphatase